MDDGACGWLFCAQLSRYLQPLNNLMYEGREVTGPIFPFEWDYGEFAFGLDSG